MRRAIALAAVVWSLLPSAAGRAADPCPAVPPERPLPSHADLPIGVTNNDDSSTNPNLRSLRPPSGTPMPIHLYAYYPLETPALDRWASAYKRAGYSPIVTLRVAPSYPPPQLYAAWVTKVLGKYGKSLDAVEMTNEPDSATIGPSDGPGPFVIDDIVAGVIAAKSYVRTHHLRTRIGFNYVFAYHGDNDTSFWSALKSKSSRTFLSSVDFLGLHTYPNYLASDSKVDDSINRTEIDALRTGRCYMRWLGLRRSVPIRVDEVGYPTPRGAGEYPAQSDYWRRVLDEIHAYRANYGIQDVDVFSWTDGNDFPWGINDVNNKPKPAYYVIRARQRRYNPKPPRCATRHHRRPRSCRGLLTG